MPHGFLWFQNVVAVMVHGARCIPPWLLFLTRSCVSIAAMTDIWLPSISLLRSHHPHSMVEPHLHTCSSTAASLSSAHSPSLSSLALTVPQDPSIVLLGAAPIRGPHAALMARQEGQADWPGRMVRQDGVRTRSHSQSIVPYCFLPFAWAHYNSLVCIATK